MNDELAARRAQREDPQDPETPSVAEVAFQIGAENERLALRQIRVANGLQDLRDKWASSGDPSLLQAAHELNDFMHAIVKEAAR